MCAKMLHLVWREKIDKRKTKNSLSEKTSDRDWRKLAWNGLKTDGVGANKEKKAKVAKHKNKNEKTKK